MTIKITITPPNLAEQWRGSMSELADRLGRALDAAMNMAAAMILDRGRADIASAGQFGQKWTDGLHMNIEGSMGNMRMHLTHDIPWAGIFETGGTISGNPLLWIPLSGTDAAGVRASAFPGGLFSQRANSKRGGGGRPLLFSISDKKPRYFGVESVTIPKKFQLTEDIVSVMSNFRSVFDDAWKATA